MGLRVRVEQKACIGSAACVETAPTVFALDEKGKSTVIVTVIEQHGTDEETIWEAAQGCPVSAIVLEDEETGEQLYP